MENDARKSATIPMWWKTKTAPEQRANAARGLTETMMEHRMADGPYRQILPFLNQATVDRFWEKVDRRSPDECWLWTASLNTSGYGRFKITSYKMAHANRVALVLGTMEDYTDLQALHSCDTPACCNPSHLRWGTHDDNMRDKLERGRNRTGNQSGEANGRAKITAADIADIIRMFRYGYSNCDIARIKPISHAMVSKIRVGKMWRPVAASLGWEPAIEPYRPDYSHRRDLLHPQRHGWL